MVRTLSAIFLALALSATASAQTRGDAAPAVTQEMKDLARSHSDMVHSTVTLTAEQRDQVYDIYVDQEQLWVALKLRLSGSGMSAEEQAMELENLAVSVDQRLDHKLSQVLTEDQMNRWMRAKQ